MNKRQRTAYRSTMIDDLTFYYKMVDGSQNDKGYAICEWHTWLDDIYGEDFLRNLELEPMEIHCQIAGRDLKPYLKKCIENLKDTKKVQDSLLEEIYNSSDYCSFSLPLLSGKWPPHKPGELR